MKRIINILAVITIILLSFVNSVNFYSHIAFADDNDDDKNELEYKMPEDPMYKATSGLYKNEEVYYTLDLVSPSEVEDKGFFDKVWDTITLKFVGDTFSDAFHYAIFYIVKLGFQFNLFMTNIMLGVLNFAYDVNIINSLIDSTEDSIQSVSGVSNFVFGSSGIFGGFLGLISLSVAIYTLYQFIVKRASISAFSGLLKSLLALTISLLFFSNYSTIVKGLNTISVEASKLILSGSMEVEENGNVTNKSIKEKMNDNIFNMFVHKPYLMLQYGTTDQSKIGDDRVLALLSLPSDSEERNEKAISEVTEYGNQTLTYPYLIKRLNFLGVMTLSNGISSIPIYLLSICLILFQFWFLAIAMISPFALLWSSLPNQFDVLKRYFLELSVPLILKMIVSVMALVIFGLTEIVYSIDSLSNGSTLGFILSTLVQCLLLLTLFLLRKRIFSIFSMGSTALNSIRSDLGSSIVNPFKKGVQNVTTVGGAIIGNKIAGPQGAMVGASIGSNIGELTTGKTSVGEFARNMGMDMYIADKISKQNKLDRNLDEDMTIKVGNFSSSSNEFTDTLKNDLMVDSNDLSVAYFPKDKGISDEMINKTLDTMEKHGLEDVTNDEMERQYEKIIDQANRNSMNGDFANNLVKGIVNERKQKELTKERQILLEGEDIQQLENHELSNEALENIRTDDNNNNKNPKQLKSVESDSYRTPREKLRNVQLNSDEIPRGQSEYMQKGSPLKQVKQINNDKNLDSNTEKIRNKELQKNLINNNPEVPNQLENTPKKYTLEEISINSNFVEETSNNITLEKQDNVNEK